MMESRPPKSLSVSTLTNLTGKKALAFLGMSSMIRFTLTSRNFMMNVKTKTSRSLMLTKKMMRKYFYRFTYILSGDTLITKGTITYLSQHCYHIN